MHNQTPINCIIVDDEVASQNVLKNFIHKTKGLQLQQICNNAEEAFIYLQLHSEIDLILLDINMPNQSGIEFYKKLQHPPKVIFTTAYPQYAVEGFELEAVDYLLKPIAYERFLTSIGKVLKRLNTAKEPVPYIVLKESKSLHKVFYNDILYLEAFGDYVRAHTVDKTIVTHSTFKNLIASLPLEFIKIHKSYCINTNRLEQVIGNMVIIAGHKIPIGQTFRDEVLKRLM